jgi:hypothetical protein
MMRYFLALLGMLTLCAPAAASTIGFDVSIALGVQGWPKPEPTPPDNFNGHFAWTFDDSNPAATIELSEINLTLAGKAFALSDVVAIFDYAAQELDIGGARDGTAFLLRVSQSFTNPIADTVFVTFEGNPYDYGAYATPLPDALPLLLAALSGFGLLGWWRSRRL